MSDQREPSAPTSALLGDLESIRSLLTEPPIVERNPEPEPEPEPEPAPPHDDEVPLLEDVVQGGVSIHEAFVSGESDFREATDESVLPGDVFKTLLSDEWREAADRLVDDARAELGPTLEDWSAAETDALNEALTLRIDATVQRWLNAFVLSHVDDLRRALLETVTQTLGEAVAARFNETSRDEDPDGA
jgi:hypothetical protein